MRPKINTTAKRAAVILLFPAFLMAGCQKQSNKAPAPQEKLAAGGHQRLRAVCADDIQKYCANADKKRRCLKENIDKLSDACKAAVSQRGGRKTRGGGDNEE